MNGEKKEVEGGWLVNSEEKERERERDQHSQHESNESRRGIHGDNLGRDASKVNM